jgi:hypothetical protein
VLHPLQIVLDAPSLLHTLSAAVTVDDSATLELKFTGRTSVTVDAKVKALRESGERFRVDLENGPGIQV